MQLKFYNDTAVKRTVGNSTNAKKSVQRTKVQLTVKIPVIIKINQNLTE